MENKKQGTSYDKGRKILENIDDELIRKVLVASMNSKQKNMVAVLRVLQKYPYDTLVKIQLKTGLPISTVHAVITNIKEIFRFELNVEVKELPKCRKRI